MRAPLATGVYNRPFGRGRELLEHLVAKSLDVRRRKAPEATAGEAYRAQEAALFPVADRVLVYAQRTSRVADIQQFSRCHRSSTIARDVAFVESVDFSHSRRSSGTHRARGTNALLRVAEAEPAAARRGALEKVHLCPPCCWG